MELILSEGRISGARYYTVEPNPPPNLVYTTWLKMQSWATATFGELPENGVWTPGARWYVNNGKFWFRERKDLEWFLLKW